MKRKMGTFSKKENCSFILEISDVDLYNMGKDEVGRGDKVL
jgi:hypothetical protein